MTYTISYYDIDGEAGSELWTGKFSEAKNLMRSSVENCSYIKSKIFDESGKLLAHYPRSLKAVIARPGK